MYYSQENEDALMDQNWDQLRIPAIGVFCEVGAGDGVYSPKFVVIEYNCCGNTAARSEQHRVFAADGYELFHAGATNDMWRIKS